MRGSSHDGEDKGGRGKPHGIYPGLWHREHADGHCVRGRAFGPRSVAVFGRRYGGGCGLGFGSGRGNFAGGTFGKRACCRSFRPLLGICSFGLCGNGSCCSRHGICGQRAGRVISYHLRALWKVAAHAFARCYALARGFSRGPRQGFCLSRGARPGGCRGGSTYRSSDFCRRRTTHMALRSA